MDSPVISHHCYTSSRPFYSTPETVWRNFPLIRTAVSSAYPIAWKLPFLSYQRGMSMTRLHSRDKSMPFCWQPLVTDAQRVSLDSVAMMLLPSSMVYIYLTLVDSTLYHSAACIIKTNVVLSRAPSSSRNTPRAISLCAIAFLVCTTALWSAVSMDLLAWWANWFQCRGWYLITVFLIYLSTNFSIAFHKEDNRVIRQYALALV